MKNTQRIAPKIPDGMVELLKNLAKSILKEQPDDIYVFAAEYFENLVRQRDGGALDKSYGKFRKYSDLEITQLNGIDVCPRCHCTLHPIPRNALTGPPDYNAPSTSPKNTDLAITAAAAATDDDDVGDDNNAEHSRDMSVNGVAIKALPRDAKSTLKNNQKNRPRLETIRSISLDSAIDDDAKSQSASPKSANDGTGRKDSKSDDTDKTDAKPEAIISTTTEKTVVKGAAAATAVVAAGAAAATAAAASKSNDGHESEHVDGTEIVVPTSKTPPHDVHIEQISSLKTDDDIDSSQTETTTTTTSVSEANTDRTVIEAGEPLNIEANEIEKSEEVITIVTKPSDESTTDDVDNLQFSDTKQMDRLRTPESDSGLSEKSFNLALQENAEMISSDINTVKSEVITTTTTKTMTTTTMSESTVEKVQVKSSEIDDDADERENQHEKVLNLKNELLSSASSPSPPPTEPEKSAAKSTEMISQATKSIETVKMEKTEEITEMKKVEIKSATKQEIAKTTEEINTSDGTERADLTESKDEMHDQSESASKPPSPTPSEKSVIIEPDENKQPEIVSEETSKTTEITTKLTDGNRAESVVKEVTASTKTTSSSEEQSEKVEIITSQTRSKRASVESLSVDEEKQPAPDSNHETEELRDSEKQTEKSSDVKTQIVVVDVETSDSKITDQTEADAVDTSKEPIEAESDEPMQDEPTQIEAANFTETIKSTQETSETSHYEHQQMELKSETTELVSETKTTEVDGDHVHQTVTSTEEKSSLEQKSAESESKHTHSEQVITKVSAKSVDTTNELTAERNGENQSEQVASEVQDLIGDSSEGAKETNLNADEIDQTVIDITEKDESREEKDSTITTTDRIEKYTEQPATASDNEKGEKSRPASSDKDRIEVVEVSSEKIDVDTVPTEGKLSKIETIKTEENHTIIEDKSDMSSSKHIESTERSTTIEKVIETDNKSGELTADAKKQDDQDHQSTTKLEEETVTEQNTDRDESKSPSTTTTTTTERTIIQTVETDKGEISSADDKKETIKTSVVESVIAPIVAVETETEIQKDETHENLSDKSIEKVEDNSFKKVTEQIAEYVEEHDGNQIKATAPLLTDIIDDDGNSSSQVNVADHKVHTEIREYDQIEQNEKTTTVSKDVDVIEVTTKENDKKVHNDIDESMVETSMVAAQSSHEGKSIEETDEADAKKVSETKEVVSSELNVTIDEPNVMDGQSEEGVTTKATTVTATINDEVEQKENEAAATTTTHTMHSSSVSESKMESETLQESKDTLKSVEIETKTTVLGAPQQITIDPIAAVIETNVTETNEISPIDPSKSIETTADNIDNEKIATNIDSQGAPNETNETTELVEAKKADGKKEAEVAAVATTIEQHDQSEQNVNAIENNDSKLTQPESESSATEVVKENLADESSNNLNGMNNNSNNDSAVTELSTMPTTSAEVDVVTEAVSKNDESSPSSANETLRTTTITTTHENSLTKTFIENEQRNANVLVAASGAVAVATAAAAAVVDNFDGNKSSNNNNANTDDMGSESSAKDEYEQAVTRSIGDDSEKELLNLSLHNGMESGQVNDGGDSEQHQQITTVEITTVKPADHEESIDSAELKKAPMQPDSLDIVADSLDVSLEPSVEADSLNIDDEEKTRSARSIDATTIVSADKQLPVASDESQDQIIKIDDTIEPPLVRDVLIEIENKIDGLEPIGDKTEELEVMGDIIDIDTSSTDNMNDQMRNELNVLQLEEKSAVPDAKEVTLEIAPKPSATMVIETVSNEKSDEIVEDKTEKDQLEKVSESNKPTLVLEKEEKREIDASAHQSTKESVERSIEIEKEGEEQKIVDETHTEIEESTASGLTPAETAAAAAATAAAAAAAGTVGAIVTTESVTKSTKESQSTQHNEETKSMAITETVIEHTHATDDNIDAKSIASVDHLKANANDLPSSDFSDTETTTNKAEKMYTESDMDETSRDEYERDEVSEIENFDLSSCGEDSLEAMYYMIRKNEIIMDRSHKESSTTTKKLSKEEERISKSFPEKATDDLEQAVRDVSGSKKVKIRSVDDSMNSSLDDVVLKKMSSDSDELQVHVMPNSEIESSVIDGGSDSSTSEPKKRSTLNDMAQSTVNESTDDEYIRPHLRSMQKSSDEFDEVAAVAAAATVAALSHQTSLSDSQSDDHQPHHHETDTFDEQHSIDMVPGNIERKILASSVSDGDSDATDGDGGGGGSRLTKDNFNVSTAFEHMIRTESITEESDTTLESAATKIQAGARGFLTRRRHRRSDGSTGTSMSKGSSIGNATIDRSIDNLIENKRELHEQTSSTAYSESFEESSEHTHSRQMLYDQTMDSVDSEKVLGITEVKVEQRKDDENEGDGSGGAGASGSGDGTASEKVPDINIQGISEESATASKRRQMLQRGDAMQRNSSAEQQQAQHGKEDKKAELAAAQSDHKNIKPVSTAKTSSKTVGKPMKRVLGVRQRSMPVQIDTQLIRILPKHMKKRVKSASLEKSSKPNVRRPSFF